MRDVQILVTVTLDNGDEANATVRKTVEEALDLLYFNDENRSMGGWMNFAAKEVPEAHR